MTFRTSLLAWCLALSAGRGAGLSAQTTASVDATGTHVEYEDDTSAGSFALTPAFILDHGSLTANASSTLSRFEGGEWSVEADGATSLFVPLAGAVQAELAAAGDLTTQANTAGSGQLGGQARLHAAGERYGAWLGGEVGRASDGVLWQTVRAGEFGGWLRSGDVTVLSRATPTGIGPRLRYVDLHALARLERERWELSASLGLRDWSRPAEKATTAWAGVSGAYWLRERLALVGAAGKYPADLAEGFPSGTYISFGIRLATRRPTTRQSLARDTGEPLPPAPAGTAMHLNVQPAGDGRWTLELRGLEAGKVEIMGDFTDWQAVDLRREPDGGWSITLPLTPGPHRMNVRFDQGPWSVPPDLPVLNDEFSGVVALLTVE